jgi:excisionase family DNA binding protein
MTIQKRTANRELVGVDQAAAILGGLSPWTLRAWAYKGTLASHKIGTRLMFDRAELDRFIAESERPRLSDKDAVA